MIPLTSIRLVTPGGIQNIAADALRGEDVGLKALGLACLPDVWFPAFFVLSASCTSVDWHCSDLEARITECVGLLGVSLTTPSVMVRSSGTNETLRHRGRLESEATEPRNILQTVRKLYSHLSDADKSSVHWIVQKVIAPVVKGHLSNERRFHLEKRDWVIEIEPRPGRPGYGSSIGIRRWRDGAPAAPSEPLQCIAESGISIALRRVASWAEALGDRLLFEWVWDGRTVHLVQADIAIDSGDLDPTKVLPDRVTKISPSSLEVFRVARSADFKRYAKLRNASIYLKLGYRMPTFFVLSDEALIDQILAGEVPSSVVRDLAELTRRPLMLRTDGTAIPEDKREMLPRSDVLTDPNEAIEWLTNDFRASIGKSRLTDARLSLIAHHFIPSVASAWARAEPGSRIVRIESLWGIPEGLYWSPHDTFEVVVPAVGLQEPVDFQQLRYHIAKRYRFKSGCVVAGSDGRFEHRLIADPYDWRSSVQHEKWLREIAYRTRQIARHEGYAVSVMWFLGNHRDATIHKVLPWYHSKSIIDGAITASPRGKLKGVNDFEVTTQEEWEALQAAIGSNKRIERVIVRPIEPALIRNSHFAQELADLAKKANFAIELSGGLLSHAYHTLRRAGARVECVDLFGAEQDVVQFNKLVRDKIADRIIGQGEQAETITLGGDALIAALKRKLVEESLEALDAISGDDVIGELADVAEVMYGICDALGVPFARVRDERKHKKESRGGFARGLMLVKTSTPHSVTQAVLKSNEAESFIHDLGSDTVILEPSALPSRAISQKPDLRRVAESDIENMLTIDADLLLRETTRSTDVTYDTEGRAPQHYVLSLRLARVKDRLRAVVRLRRTATQLEFEME